MLLPKPRSRYVKSFSSRHLATPVLVLVPLPALPQEIPTIHEQRESIKKLLSYTTVRNGSNNETGLRQFGEVEKEYIDRSGYSQVLAASRQKVF